MTPAQVSALNALAGRALEIVEIVALDHLLTGGHHGASSHLTVYGYIQG